MTIMEPFGVNINLHSGIHAPVGSLIRRSLSDMQGMYADAAAAAQIMAAEGDRLIYEVYASTLPEEAGQVLYCTTIIHPGRIGDEYHMTKGHFHEKRDRAETYFALAGEGYLVLQTEDGEFRAVPMPAGTMAYVPPYWAHRTINTGAEPFVFFAAWPGDAGHDYGTIERDGFARLLVERDGQPAIVDNPRWAAR